MPFESPYLNFGTTRDALSTPFFASRSVAASLGLRSSPPVYLCIVGVDHSLKTGDDGALFRKGDVSREMALDAGEIDRGCLVKCTPTGCGDVGERRPPIVGVGKSFDEASVLELGDDSADAGS